MRGNMNMDVAPKQLLRQSLYSRMRITSKTVHDINKMEDNFAFRYVFTYPGIISGAARPQNLGGHLRGKLMFWGGKIEFLKRYCYLPMPLSQDFCPPPKRFVPSQKGAIFLGIPPPGDEYPRNIAPPPRGANAPGICPPPFRIFAPHICDVVYSNNFVILILLVP